MKRGFDSIDIYKVIYNAAFDNFFVTKSTLYGQALYNRLCVLLGNWKEDPVAAAVAVSSWQAGERAAYARWQEGMYNDAIEADIYGGDF